MGVTHVSVSSGLYEDDIGANRSIVEQQNSQTDRRYFKRISLDPNEFELNLLLDDDVTENQIESIFSWLLNDYYEELFFENEIDKIYYCMPISKPKIMHNGMNEGYISIQMRCFDGYLYSREMTKTFDLSANPSSGTTITLPNDGHVEVYPLLSIALNDTALTILNLTTNESTELTNVMSGETITLDNENEEITSSLAGVYRFDNHNDVFVRILTPSNQFKVTGKCTLTFTYRTKRKF
jgi:phage-related protein